MDSRGVVNWIKIGSKTGSKKRMNDANLIDLLFGGMEKLGPGSDADTLKVLEMLPVARHEVVVDAGCGAGRQTLVLADRLKTLVHAVDSYEPFLVDLANRAKQAGVERFVETHCMDMANIPDVFAGIDLLWSEGAAYSIGFSNALKTWHPALAPGGFAAVSEISWFKSDVPAEVRSFFQNEYPDMQTVEANLSAARDAGYKVLNTHTLPGETWVEGYYDVLEPRAKGLLDHPDEAVRDFAAETLEEIRAFGLCGGSYGYVFYLLQKA